MGRFSVNSSMTFDILSLVCGSILHLFSIVFIEMDEKLSKISYSHQGYWKGIAAIKNLQPLKRFPKMTQKMADRPSPLTNLSSYAKTHSSPHIRCVNTKRRSPGRPSFPSTRYCEAWPGPKNIQIRFDCSLCGQLSRRS